MVTRITHARLGRTLAADTLTWRLFWALQGAALARLAGALAFHRHRAVVREPPAVVRTQRTVRLERVPGWTARMTRRPATASFAPDRDPTHLQAVLSVATSLSTLVLKFGAWYLIGSVSLT